MFWRAFDKILDEYKQALAAVGFEVNYFKLRNEIKLQTLGNHSNLGQLFVAVKLSGFG